MKALISPPHPISAFVWGVMRWVFTMQCTNAVIASVFIMSCSCQVQALHLSVEDICLHSYNFLHFNALKDDEDLKILNTHLQISGLTLHLELIHVYRSVATQLSTRIWEQLCYNNGPMRTRCTVLCVQLFHFQYNNKSVKRAPHPKIKKSNIFPLT